MTWTTGITDLRILLSDGPTDKLRAIKNVMGQRNGINTTFKTFEFRRVTDFSASATVDPLGVYFQGALLAASAIQSDSPDTGYFKLGLPASSITNNITLEAAYYIQWFNDTELDGFLVRGSNWIGQDDVYANTPSGLKTAVLKYAAHEAYQKLALKYAEDLTATYQLQDGKKDQRMEVVDAYQKASKMALSDAYKSRDDFYSRKGQALAPRSRSIAGRVRDIPPKG